MARHQYGPAPVFGADGQLARARPDGIVTFDEAQTLPAADVALTPSGAATGGYASSDERGACTLWGPDNYRGGLWVDFGSGPMPIFPTLLLGDATAGTGGSSGGVGPESITDEELAPNAVTEGKILNGAVTKGKLDRPYLEGETLTGEGITVAKTGDEVTLELEPVTPADLDPAIADAVAAVGTAAAVGPWGQLGPGAWIPDLHPDPPTVTLSAANAGTTLSGSGGSWDRTAESFTPGLAADGASTGAVRWLGPDMVSATYAEMGNRNGGVKSAPLTTSIQVYRSAVEFETDAPALEYRLISVGANVLGYRVWIDDMPVSAAPVTGVGASGGAAYRLKIDFAGWSNPRRLRRVKIQAVNSRVIGMSMDPTATLMEPGTPVLPRLAVLGDSHTEGTGGEWAWSSWVHHAARRLRMDAVDLGVGGTGYLNPGPTSPAGKVKFRDRIADIPLNANWIIIQGGYNDITGYTPAAVQAEALLLFQAVRARHPKARILALSPFNSTGVTAADSRTAMRDAIRSAAIAAGVLFIDTMGWPTRPSMITGTGKVGLTNGTGNSDIYVSNDGVHYSAAGYEFIGSFIASQIQRSFTAFGTPIVSRPIVAPPTTTTGPYPFAFNAATYRAKTKEVYAHYMAASNLVRSISNTVPDYYDNVYLTAGTTAEGGKHLPYGCWARDAPILRPVSSSPTWKLDDMVWECQQAQASGIDGWYLLLSGPSGANQTTATLMIQAAEQTGHRIILQPDCNGPINTMTPAAAADWLAPMCASPAIKRNSGKPVVSMHYAQRLGTAVGSTAIPSITTNRDWIIAFKAAMASRGAAMTTGGFTAVDVDLIFDNEDNYLATHAAIARAIGRWGARSVASNSLSTRTGKLAAIKAAGCLAIQTVAFEDERPRSGVYDEALGWQAFQRQWDIAIQGNADIVQLATWNDTSETSSFYPSRRHGWALLDALVYYLAWFKDGSAPTITQDVVFGAHRSAFAADQGTYRNASGTTLFQTVRPESSAPVDIVDAMWFLTASATCRITVGGGTPVSATLSAGLQRLPTPAALGAVDPAAGTNIKFEIVRSSDVVASVTSPYKVNALGTSLLDDKCYNALSSARPPAA